MKLTAYLGALALAGATLHAAANPADDVKAAAKKLAGQSYTWKSTTEMAGRPGGGGGGGQWRPGPTEGRTAADGTTHVTMTRGDNTFEAVMKAGKVAMKTPEGWQAPPEPGAGGGPGVGRGGGGGGGGAMLGRTLATMRPPAAEIEDLLAKVKELRQTETGYVGDLTEAGVKELLTRGGRGGGGRAGGPGGGALPEPQDAKGTVKFWLKDGQVAKYELNVQGRMTMGQQGRDVEINRTTAVEISNVGATKVEVPEDAKKLLG